MNDYARRRAIRLEIDVDKCRLNYAAGACTAGTDVATGTSQAGATDATIKLAAGASAVDDFYNGYAVTEADGRRAIVTDYDGATKVAIVDRDWPVNLLPYSEQVDQWIATGGTVTANARRSPSGQITADRIEEDGTTGHHYVSRTVAGLAISDVLYMRVRVRADEVSAFRIDVSNVIFGATAYADFDLAAVSCSTGGAGSADCWETPDGWIECEYITPAAIAAGVSGITYRLMRAGATSYAGTVGEGLYLWGAQASLRSSAYIETDSAAIGLPDAVAYRIVEVGGECYNSFRTCQDPSKYDRGGKTWIFGTPGGAWPKGRYPRAYIQKESFAPMEIDLENGLAVRASATITMRDEAGTDVEADPYHATRSEEAGGTFWSRWIARNPHYVGRPARLAWAYLTDGYDPAEFTEEFYIVENVNGPDGNGEIKFTFKDPTKLADREETPMATEGKLVGDITAAALSCTLESGQGALYSASGFVRIGDEVIQYDTNTSDVMAWSDVSRRAQFGTTAEEHEAGDGVQQCKVYQSAPVADVINDLLTDAGLDASQIDYAGFQAEDSLWLSTSFAVTACISEPEKVSSLIKELLIQVGAYLYWHPVVQKAKFAVIAPVAPGVGVAGILTDESGIIGGSSKVEKLDDLRITREAVYYDRRSSTNDDSKLTSYGRAEVVIDVAAETSHEYNGVRSITRYSRWFTAANAAAVRAASRRRVARFRDAPQRITIHADPKDAAIEVGDLIDATMRQIVGFDGRPSTIRCLVTQRRDENGRIRLRLRATTLNKRYAFVAPSSAGDYPDSDEYAHVVDGTTLTFADGSGPYYVF